jgi:hypothetical protein
VQCDHEDKSSNREELCPRGRAGPHSPRQMRRDRKGDHEGDEGEKVAAERAILRIGRVYFPAVEPAL